MKTTFKLAIILLAILLTMSCSPDNPTPEPEPPLPPELPEDDGYKAGTGTGTYISQFVNNNTFDVVRLYLWFLPYRGDEDILCDMQPRSIGWYPRENEISATPQFVLSMDGDRYISAKSHSSEYDELIEQLRDYTSPFILNNEAEASFVNGMSIPAYAWDGMPAITNAIADFDIMIKPQWISSIPAGEPANEAFAVLYSDMADFVWRGYEKPIDSKYITWTAWMPLIKGLDTNDYMYTDLHTYYIDVDATDKEAYCNKPYLGQDLYLYAQYPPDDRTKEYTFTFKMTFADGTVVTKQLGPYNVVEPEI